MSPRKTERKAASISDVLLRRRLIDPDALRKAEEEAETTRLHLEKHLLRKKLVSADQMTLVLAEYAGMPPVKLKRFTPPDSIVKLMEKGFLAKRQAMPVSRIGASLTVAMSDPFDLSARDDMQAATALTVVPLVASEMDIAETLDRVFPSQSADLSIEDILKQAESDTQITHEKEEEDEQEDIDETLQRSEGAPVIRMVSMILVESLRQSASDIHLEPQEHSLRLRYRIDGILIERFGPPKHLQGAIVSRIKLMSGMDISEHRIPQDGRIKIRALDKEVDLRVNILPTIFGEKIVMRLLDKSSLFPNLAALGLEKMPAQAMQKAISEPNGIVLVTGPTGSGKTTTLYSCLMELNQPEVNIITCEDPVEYQLGGINQVQINAFVGMTFAAALRSILRQDPDIILVGEIRDGETAEIAVKSALTGHLVLSTLHTNDAPSAVTRMVDMGVDPSLLASALILAQAQRLIRRLCPVCKKPRREPPSEKMLKTYNIPASTFSDCTVYETHGCVKCRNIGYKGRMAIMEVLPIDREIRQAIVEKSTASQIARLARAKGMLSLKDIGVSKVRSGETSLEAALRVTGGGE